MQSNRAEALSLVHNRAEQASDARLFGPWPQAINAQSINSEMVERGAQALFEHIFSGTKRHDGNHLWVNCDDFIKEAFRAEAKSVLEASVPFMGNDARAPERLF